MPAVAVYQERSLRLRLQRKARHPIRAVPQLRAGERETLPAGRRVESECDRDLADIGVHRDDGPPCILDALARPPLRNRPGQLVVVGPQQGTVRVEEMEKDPKVPGDRREPGGRVEADREIERTAEGHRDPVHRQGGRRHRIRGRRARCGQHAACKESRSQSGGHAWAPFSGPASATAMDCLCCWSHVVIVLWFAPRRGRRTSHQRAAEPPPRRRIAHVP